MKNIFFAIAIFAVLFISCRNKSPKQTDTHVHDDGTTHINHDTSVEKMPKQELFEVAIDSLSTENDTLIIEDKKEHTHEGGHSHKH